MALKKSATKTPRRRRRNARQARQGDEGLIRRQQAVELHLQGRTYAQIGDELGVSLQRIGQMIGEWRAEAARNLKESGDHWLEEALAGADVVINALAKKVAKGDVKAALATLKARDQRNRLLGNYAPEKHEHGYREGEATPAAARAAFMARFGALPSPSANGVNGAGNGAAYGDGAAGQDGSAGVSSGS